MNWANFGVFIFYSKWILWSFFLTPSKESAPEQYKSYEFTALQGCLCKGCYLWYCLCIVAVVSFFLWGWGGWRKRTRLQIHIQLDVSFTENASRCLSLIEFIDHIFFLSSMHELHFVEHFLLHMLYCLLRSNLIFAYLWFFLSLGHAFNYNNPTRIPLVWNLFTCSVR